MWCVISGGEGAKRLMPRPLRQRSSGSQPCHSVWPSGGQWRPAPSVRAARPSPLPLALEMDMQENQNHRLNNFQVIMQILDHYRPWKIKLQEQKPLWSKPAETYGRLGFVGCNVYSMAEKMENSSQWTLGITSGDMWYFENNAVFWEQNPRFASLTHLKDVFRHHKGKRWDPWKTIVKPQVKFFIT